MNALLHRLRRAVTGRDPPRGWLLIEVAIGGVMASVIVAALLVNIGSANDRTTVISRQMTAMMLAQQAIEESRAAGTAVTSSGNIGVPTGLSGTYTRSRTESSSTLSVSGTNIDVKDVSVTVSFQTHEFGTKTVTLQTRISEPQ